ncbi:MAG: molybdopterin-dependent oxidoreductase [Syntrophomonadales bacterium]
MQSNVKPRFYRLIMVIFSMILMAGVFSLISSAPVQAASDSLEITGDGVTNPATFTLDQLKDMEQCQYLYSCINTWPTKKWYVGKGVRLSELLERAGMTDEATLIRFSSIDGYAVTLTVDELFKDKRYRFPNFKNGADGDGHIPGDPSGRVEVEPIVALISVEGSDNPEYMNDLNTLLLMLGQRTVTEQTGNLFVKGSTQD